MSYLFRQHRRQLRIQGLHQFRFKNLMIFRCCNLGLAMGEDLGVHQLHPHYP
jgi:hypothetical protein